MSVTDYIRKRRSTHAALDVVSTEIAVIDITIQHGFSSQEAFTRSFKRMFQLPPKKYRKYFQSFYIEREGVSMQKGIPKGWILSESHPTEYEIVPSLTWRTYLIFIMSFSSIQKKSYEEN